MQRLSKQIFKNISKDLHQILDHDDNNNYDGKFISCYINFNNLSTTSKILYDNVVSNNS